MEVSPNRALNAFAMVVDINSFTAMVSHPRAAAIASFVRDVLVGGVEAVEQYGGTVVGLMGDAFLGVLPSAQSTMSACWQTARDLDRLCESISVEQERNSFVFPYSPGGPSLKIGIEFGWIDVTTIKTRFLGEQCLLIGPAINYAHRILGDGNGNRCHVGPVAATRIRDLGYGLEGPFTAEGKQGERPYEYWTLDMGEIWREGVRKSSDESYWG